MKPLVIYHANCADGFGAAFAAWLKFGDEAEYLPMQYGQVKCLGDFYRLVPSQTKGNEIYILDFSFLRETMDQIFQDAKRVVWLDHHASVFKDYGWTTNVCLNARDIGVSPQHHIDLDNSKSGAMLAWEYFHPGTEVPMLFRHIDDYDRWQFLFDGTKEFNKALWSYAPWNFEQWRREFLSADMGKHNLTFDQTARYSALRKEGAAILRAHDQNVQGVVKGAARKCVIRIFHSATDPLACDEQAEGFAANCPPHLTSDVGHELAVQSGTFGLCWKLAKEDKDGIQIANCSLRSNGDYDVSAIAKAFGGGGHKSAAGFEVPINTLLEWLK